MNLCDITLILEHRLKSMNKCTLKEMILTAPAYTNTQPSKEEQNRMHCKMVFNFALRHDIALLQDNRLLA